MDCTLPAFVSNANTLLRQPTSCMSTAKLLSSQGLQTFFIKHCRRPQIAMYWPKLWHRGAGSGKDARSATCTQERGCISLLDLPESLISSILRCLPTESKCHAELVCGTFRELLSNPTPGEFVWDNVRLSDPPFQEVPLEVLNRRIKGISYLYFDGQIGGVDEYLVTDQAVREQHILLSLLPLVSGLLLPGAAGLELDIAWVQTDTLLAAEQPDFQSQYWLSMSNVLTRLSLTIQDDKMTEQMSATICHLHQLKELTLNAEIMDLYGPEHEAFVLLDLPLLERLEVHNFNVHTMKLTCPELRAFTLGGESLGAFCGMPSGIQEVDLSPTFGESISLKEIFPPHSAKLLRVLSVEDVAREFADLETLRRLCLNGRLSCLNLCCFSSSIVPAATFSGGAFAVNALWQAVPDTLQYVTLDLPLDKGIPKILEQLPSLVELYLGHCKKSRLHLDRPLDPFLDMPKLKHLKFLCDRQGKRLDGTGMCMWTPAALMLLGLAEDRIMQMQKTSPERSFTLIY